jgi:aspartyl-tRNA synthetase
MAAGAPNATSKALNALRLGVAGKEGLLKRDQFAVEWVIDFPLFEWNADEQRWDSVQHPFTSPTDEDAARLATDPGGVRGKAYDLVLNGWEIGGGSIRIHDSAQARSSACPTSTRPGALRPSWRRLLGTPPHGGIALGLDRI